MPNRDIGVYISSTSSELPEHRAAVIKALKTLTLQPHDLAVKADQNPVELYKQGVLNSRIFIGIYGHRLGWLPADSDKSLTEMEYDWAGEVIFNGQPIPRLCYFLDDGRQSDNKPDFAMFKERVKAQGIRFFSTPDDLAAQVLAALNEVLKTTLLSGYERTLLTSMERDNKPAQAAVLYDIAKLHEALGEKDKSLEYYRQALVLFVKIKDKSSQATTLNNMGVIYQTLGEKGKALGCYQQALPLCIEVGNKAEQAATLTSIGGVYQTLGESDKALSDFQQSHTLYLEIGDKSGQAMTLNQIGGVYSAQGQQDEALDYAQLSRALYAELGDKNGQATALNSIGLAYSRSGEKAKALDTYRQALPLRIEVGDAHGEAVTRSNIAAILWDQDQQDEAAIYMKQASDLVARLDVSSEVEDSYLMFSTASGVETQR